MSLNKVTLIGHLGQDPELRNLPSGQGVGRFSVATNESYTDKEGKRQEFTEWHQVVTFGEDAMPASPGSAAMGQTRKSSPVRAMSGLPLEAAQ